MTQPLDLAALRDLYGAPTFGASSPQHPAAHQTILALLDEVERLRAWQAVREADAQVILDRCVAANAQSARLREAVKMARGALEPLAQWFDGNPPQAIKMSDGRRASAALATIDAALADGVKEEAHEGHPCSMCDSSGRCTFACEGAESIAPPTAEQVSANRYWSMLILAAKALDDLSLPDPVLRKLTQYQDACGRLRDEIRAVALADGGEG